MPRRFARQPRSEERSEFPNGNAVTVNSQVAQPLVSLRNRAKSPNRGDSNPP